MLPVLPLPVLPVLPVVVPPVVVPVALCVMLLQMDMDPVVTGVGRTAAFTWLYIFTAMGASLGIVGCVCATNTAAVL
eukprot:COSAG06_NODE_27034_length_602_cov_2.332008_1_plen_77_part_00